MGSFGEFRFGDEHGAADTTRIAGFTVAVGTRGIHGSAVDTGLLVGPTDSDEATEIVS